MFLKKSILVGLGVTFGLLTTGLVSQASSYKVHQGDTVSKIAQTYGTSINAIANENKLSNPNVIYVGEELTIGEKEAQQPAKTVQQPVEQNQQPQQVQQAVQQPVQKPQQNQSQEVSQNNNQTSQSSQTTTSGSSAESQIAQAESGGSWTAQNGQYYGKYQLDSSYLHGDYSPANQEKVFHQYCNQRYGSVQSALSFRESHGWY